MWYRLKPESGKYHDTLKLKIIVPQTSTIKEYVHKTGDFQTDTAAISKEKQGQYNVWFRSGENLKKLSFRMIHVCKLKQGKEKSDKVGACENYDLINDQNSISNIIYAKTPVPEPTKR